MKALLIKLLKIFLTVTLVVLIVLVAFAVVLTLDWPWWMGAFILAGLLGLTLIFEPGGKNAIDLALGIAWRTIKRKLLSVAVINLPGLIAELQGANRFEIEPFKERAFNGLQRQLVVFLNTDLGLKKGGDSWASQAVLNAFRGRFVHGNATILIPSAKASAKRIMDIVPDETLKVVNCKGECKEESVWTDL